MAAKTITVASPWGSVHATLTGGAEDVITITGLGEQFRVDVFNRAASGGFYVRSDATTAVAEAAGTAYVPAGQAIGWEVGPGVTVVRIISAAADPYSVHAVTQGAWTS